MENETRKHPTKGDENKRPRNEKIMYFAKWNILNRNVCRKMIKLHYRREYLCT
jgi:hypothetical protein